MSDNLEKQLKEFFDRVDVNKNGFINIKLLLKDMIVTDDMMKKIVEAAEKSDLDKDGNLNFEEFKIFDKYTINILKIII